MPPAHRNGDARLCGASTVVQNQGSTYVDGRLWAVQGDPDSHEEGGLIPSGSGVAISGIPIIVHAPDNAQPDKLCPILGEPHCHPKTAAGSGKTFAYDGG
jgi:hypothetical protein